MDAHTIKLRVYERGAGETNACGTGACAAAVAGVLRGYTKNKVDVHLPGGILGIEWGADNGVRIAGAAAMVYQGVLDSSFFQ